MTKKKTTTPKPASTAAKKRAMPVLQRPLKASAPRFGRPRAQYSAIDRDRELVARISLETQGEDAQLTGAKRGRLLAIMRDNFRNTPEARAICEQRALNIVGDIGGKLQIVTQDTNFNTAANAFFSRISRHIEFTNAIHLNELLRRIQISLDIGGDVVVVADVATPSADAPFCGSGQVRVFDADEIGNLEQQAFDATYGAKGYVQRDGLIYDSFGRHVGVCVSTAERGKSTFAQDKSIVFLRDPALVDESNWVYLQHAWRPNQGRGVSPFAPVASTLHNVETIAASETAAAKLNAQMLGAYKRTSDQSDESDVDDALRAPVLIDENGISVDGGEDPIAVSAEPEIFPDEFARASGAFFDVLPDGYEAQLYDTKRPNGGIPEFLRFLTGRAASALGMGVQYVTLDPLASYSAFRGAQVLARPSFKQAQKYLERNLCDWLASILIQNAINSGILPQPANGEDFRSCLFWSWAAQEECNAVDEQNAIRLKLQNGTASYREIFGPSWRERLEEIAEEAEACRAAGLIHPMTATVAGAVVDPNNKESETEE
jgi:capsid protein